MIFIFLIAITCVTLVALLTYARWYHGTLEKLGIPIVEYSNSLLGSTRERYENPGGLLDVRWMKKYGQVYGVYDGREAQVHICNPELVRLICVKDQEYFNNKRPLKFGNEVMDGIVSIQQDYDKWKLLRSLATPAFSSAKLKLMSLPIQEATQDFVEEMKLKIKRSGDVVVKKFALDNSIYALLNNLISRCLFSIKMTGPGDVSTECSKMVLDYFTPPEGWINHELLIWSHVFPRLRGMTSTAMYNAEPLHRFTQFLRQLMDQRRASGQKMNDVVDLCLEWWGKLDSPEYKKLNITEGTLVAQVLVFFAASQDQISTMVTAVIFHMSQRPELERRIYEEVDKVFDKHGGKLGHVQIKELVLINSCLSECLRLYTFFHQSDRLCTKDWENTEFNLKIKKGMSVVIPIWALNRNPEFYENPDEYDPDRFMPGNKENLNPYCSTGFGFGPRNCYGKGLALEIMPILLAHLLKELRFIGRKDTELRFLPGGPYFSPHAPIYVDVVERTEGSGRRSLAPSF